MKSSTRWIIAAPLLLAGGIVAGAWLAYQFHLNKFFGSEAVTESDHEADPELQGDPTATVRTAKVVVGDMVRTVDVYGSVIAQPGATVLTVMQAEMIVRRVLAQNGQQVHANDPLCEADPSPSTKAALESARAEVESTTKLLEGVQEKQSMNLGTRQDVLQAQAAQRAAQLKLAQLEASLPDPSGVIRSSVDGRVTAVHIESGAVVAPGTPLLETLANDAVVIQLGVPPEDANRLRPEQEIAIQPVVARSAQPLSVKIRLINATIDPASRLVTVVADPPKGVGLLLGESVRGAIETKEANVLIVPRSAVLPREDQHVVFTVSDGHAHARIVQIGLQTQDAVEIVGGDLAAGDDVVVLGNYELTDGMAIQVESGT